MIQRKTWEEFRSNGLLWWVNMILHTLGWSIIVVFNTETGKVVDVYPARVKFRGFSDMENKVGYANVTQYIVENGHELENDFAEQMKEVFRKEMG